METIKLDDVKKAGVKKVETPVKKEVVKEKTISETFIEECDEQETKIFEQLKGILIDQCEKYEFEAVTDDNLEDFAEIITYVKNGIISLESDGVLVKLRKSLIDTDGNDFTDSIKILFDKNEDREIAFTKGIKISKKSIESQKDYTLAVLAASFDSVNNKMISVKLTKKFQKTNNRDYMLLLTCFNFFRN